MSPTPPLIRPRSTAAIVATRSDGQPAAAAPGSAGLPSPARDRGSGVRARRWRRIGTVATWTALGLLIAALWALLLLGDSLAPLAP